ncbi:GNAT family N-acetyltransferase [Streptomyces sp. H10-C2]|uniref:GNAT family N-acetyltransferase n=1 Tax=unclassified Streptomyces TaxID=2593676 RepID=UPI0024BA94EE|nr:MULTISPECIES: GNAT family N-acetyltransferase [unclassified Streptomyces]MDJ0343385.1 GNAT family N-acetyltransferase [Streptomyces sp. PH10-H1]MDJ0371804.1 GNAT family N-acetyltransferase [Streptomyces sp. H10-C2]
MTGTAVRQAVIAEEETVARLLATVFDELPLHRWLVPTPERHPEIFPHFFQILVGHALRHGTVYVTEDLRAAAVWLPMPSPDIEDYDDRLSAACQDHVERFHQLDEAMGQAYPADRGDHDHLAFLVVHPDLQGDGIGSHLLRLHHDILDRACRPAYLEATSPASRKLYLRHGYADLGRPLALPFDPEAMYPMWRPAQSEAAQRGATHGEASS